MREQLWGVGAAIRGHREAEGGVAVEVSVYGADVRHYLCRPELVLLHVANLPGSQHLDIRIGSNGQSGSSIGQCWHVSLTCNQLLVSCVQSAVASV